MILPFLLAAGLSGGRAAAQAAGPVKNPDTYNEVEFNDMDSLDPAWSYDTASDAVILNIYEPLFFADKGSTTKMVPLIAEKLPTRANGLISKDGRTYTIPIRRGVSFQDGTPMTVEDARYSLMYFLLYDRDGGASALLMQPLLGYSSTRDEKGRLNAHAYRDAARAIQIKGDNLVLHLPKPCAPLISILATWAPIVSKKWAIQHGWWDGTEATWAKFNNPKKQDSPFYDKANGTGAFELVRWDRQTHEVVLKRNDHYWRKPARLKYVIIRGVDEFETRKLEIESGDADSIYATPDVFAQLQNIPGVRIIDNLVGIEDNPVAFFTFKVDPVANPYIRSGRLDGRGIPPDFFSDINVRKAFAYAFDYQGFIRDVNHGKGHQATGCIPAGMLGHNPKQKTYGFDPKKAEEYFKKAYGGQVWDKGFEFSLTYNSGNIQRQIVAQIIKHNVERLNSKFRIDVQPIDWPEFLDSYLASKFPIFVMAWQADYPDPHDFAFPLMHSQGFYPKPQGYDNPKADHLVDEALATIDPARRENLYRQLQEIEYEDAPHLLTADVIVYRTQREWVHGWYSNPIYPDDPYGAYYYPIYKALKQ